MWEYIAGKILRNRILILIILGIVTIFMGYHAKDARLSYKFGGLLPKHDSTFIAYQNFQNTFEEDGKLMVIGVEGQDIFQIDNFLSWYNMGLSVREVHGVDSVFSIAHSYELVKDEENKRFQFLPLVDKIPANQADVDRIKERFFNLPFYRDLLYVPENHATLMMIYVNDSIYNSDKRNDLISGIREHGQHFKQERGVNLYYSGLPFIRTVVTNKVKKELRMFTVLAILITSFLLFLFFKSFRVVVFCMLVVCIGVIWSVGTISLFNYEISMLMGLIPPLIIVIGIPNCVFLLNKYHNEFSIHGNKIKSLSRVIYKVGNATFLTNTTTAMGFATFIFTHSDILKEFGVVASINIIGVFVVSLLIIPIVFSFLPDPKKKHIMHLDRKWLDKAINLLVVIVSGHRTKVYVVTSIVVVVAIFGISRMTISGNFVDDLPHNDDVRVDLKFFEDNFSGVMPFEVTVDTKKRKHATKDSNLKKIAQLQDSLATFDVLSRSLSIADASKFARQAFYNGNPERYDLIKSNEKSFIAPYLTADYDGGGVSKTFLDSSQQIARISMKVADIGAKEMESLLVKLRPMTDSIFSPENYEVQYTGTSIAFLKGTTYLVKNLFISLTIAVGIIAIMMSLLFNSARMVVISLLPNFIPLLFTASIMGFFGIPIKPSTILVFSIAFGISIDDTIHFLAKYRQELKQKKWDIKSCVLSSVRETGVSMLYTSIILFFGFSMFGLSNFGGTVALGILVSVTLLVAMLTNLVLLPSLLLTLEKKITTKAFNEPLINILDEEEDIDLKELVIKKVES
jgi:uncharacterized protein